MHLPFDRTPESDEGLAHASIPRLGGQRKMGWEPGLAGSCSQRLWGRRLPLQGRREKSLCLEPGKVSRLLMPCAPWATTPQSLGTHGQTDRRIFSSPSLAPLTSSSFSPRIPSGQHPPDTSSPQIIPLLSLPGSRQNTLSRIAKILQTPNLCRVETMTPSFHKIKEPRSPAPASLRPKVTGSEPLLSQTEGQPFSSFLFKHGRWCTQSPRYSDPSLDLETLLPQILDCRPLASACLW